MTKMTKSDIQKRQAEIMAKMDEMDEKTNVREAKIRTLTSEEQKQEIYQYIEAHQHPGKEKRMEHVESIKELKKTQEKMKNQKICPYCKTSLVLRKGQYGEFYGCSNFPKCRYTLKI